MKGGGGWVETNSNELDAEKIRESFEKKQNDIVCNFEKNWA